MHTDIILMEMYSIVECWCKYPIDSRCILTLLWRKCTPLLSGGVNTPSAIADPLPKAPPPPTQPNSNRLEFRRKEHVGCRSNPSTIPKHYMQLPDLTWLIFACFMICCRWASMYRFLFLYPFSHSPDPSHPSLVISISMVKTPYPSPYLSSKCFIRVCLMNFQWQAQMSLWVAGKAGVQFYTQIKTVTQQWKDSPSRAVSLAMPTSQTA